MIVVTLVAENGTQQPRQLTQPLCLENISNGSHCSKTAATLSNGNWQESHKSIDLTGSGSACSMAGPECRRKRSLTKVKEKLVSRITPNTFIMIELYRQRKLIPGEALFLHNLKQILDKAMPKPDTGAKEQLIKFLAGLAATVNSCEPRVIQLIYKQLLTEQSC